MKVRPAGWCGPWYASVTLPMCLLVCAPVGNGQQAASTSVAPPPVPSNSDSLAEWTGLPLRSVSFKGVALDRLHPLDEQIARAAGSMLNTEFVKVSLRQLYTTGLFDTVRVEGKRQPSGVDLVFNGTPRTFIGTVSVDGAKGATLNTQLARASQLTAGTRFTPARLEQALAFMRRSLAESGFHEARITPTLSPRADEQLMDISFSVTNGPQARVGSVQVAGDAGMSVAEFRRHAHLKQGARVDADTTNRALASLLKQYRGRNRLEAEIKLESRDYRAATKEDDFHFSASQGPVVKVIVEGVSLNENRLKRVIPIFEEGTVDDDLLNEGNRRLHNYCQRQGYFDVKVEHERQSSTEGQVTILYRVELGLRRRVAAVTVVGNRYFDAPTLKELLAVRPADALDRQGVYSQALVAADIAALHSVYRNNGFGDVRVTAETAYEETAGGSKSSRPAPLDVIYRIDEGRQLRLGTVRLEGAEHIDAAVLTAQMNTAPNQLLSPQNLASDRDALLTAYLSRGFDEVRIEVTQQFETEDAGKVDVVFKIDEGRQIFVRKVLLTGLRSTRPAAIARAITLHPGDPLSQTALEETQRNLYEFALFSEVEAAIENPNGSETDKTVLVQAIEARRWALTYGFGFEAQTGNPVYNCGGIIASGSHCNPNGKTGVSPRVVADITRNGLFGREQSLSLRATYGLLEQKVDLLFQNPHFEGDRNFGLTLSGGYASSLDVTTYVASRLQAGMRFTESFLSPGSLLSKANTIVYEFDFRRVRVQANSLQVAPDQIAKLSTAVRIAGPALTWVRDTRDSPLDAHRGTYTSFQDFVTARAFGAQASFNRLDLQNSSYYSFIRGRFVLARNTRFGQERAFGSASAQLIPLPERLYAGGTTSLRGFSINAAGPRDPQTGYPIGGAGALINSTELRLPPPTLPWLGDTVSFVLFHDMGNVFARASDAWPSALRLHQPGQQNCTVALNQCSFNYFSHAPGLGVRYHTPVGPVRLDFSYNLNPPKYVVTFDYANPDAKPYSGQAAHFNFFFSLGQTF